MNGMTHSAVVLRAIIVRNKHNIIIVFSCMGRSDDKGADPSPPTNRYRYYYNNNILWYTARILLL